MSATHVSQVMNEKRGFVPGVEKKIRSRAPLRLGLAGGGTDVSPYSEDFGGAILNLTIDRYAYSYIEHNPENLIRFVAEDIGVDESFPLDLTFLSSAKLKLHAAVYQRMVASFSEGGLVPLTLRTSVDAPPGSGLGSSSALVVSMVEAFKTLLNVPLGPYEVAHLAFEIERLDLGLSGGKQDHYAAAFGGINYIEFLAGDRVIVNPLRILDAVLYELETSLITCFSGVSRRSEQIIDQQRQGMKCRTSETVTNLHRLKVDAVEMKQALLRGNIPEMANILQRSWTAKKGTASGVSTPEIEHLLGVALGSGAKAGKVSGAGGGGFIMFFVPPEDRLRVIRKLNESGGSASGVSLTKHGVESWICPKSF